MGGFWDALGGQNDFQATAPLNNFSAQQAQLAQTNFGGGIAQGMQNAQQNYGQQSDFINQLRGQANGSGPSVAQGMLSQATDRNNANAASAIGSQRGMNPGLAAKLMLDQQAGNNQQAAGQGAMLRSQEMMQGQNMLGQALQGQAGSNLGAMGQYLQGQQGQNALALQNSMGAQGINAGVAAGNQQAQIGAQNINAGISAQNAQGWQKLAGGIASGIGSAAGMMVGMPPGGGGNMMQAFGGGGSGQLVGAEGGAVPGRARELGNSYENDTVDAKLSPGEIVLPRSVTEAADAPDKAREFVRAIQRKKSGGTSEGYGKVLEAQRALHERISHLERLCAGGMVR